MLRRMLTCILWWACVFSGRVASTDLDKNSLATLEVSGNTNFSMYSYSNGIEAMSGWTFSCIEEEINGTEVCHLYLKNFSSRDPDSKDKACPVPVDHQNIYTKGYYSGEVPSERRWRVDSHRFGPKTFILHWREVVQRKPRREFSVQFRIVNMQDCGVYSFSLSRVPDKILRNQLNHYLENHNILLMRDSVSIIYRFSSDSALTQETFNSTGHRIQGPVGPEHFDISESAEMMIDNPWSDFNVDDRERFKVKFICSSYPCKTKLHNGNLYAMSTASDYLTSCEKREGEISGFPPTWDCVSPSPYGPREPYPVKFDHVPQQFMILNVYGAAFVAMVTQILKDYELKITLTMVAEDGRLYKSVPFHTLSGGFMHHGLLGHFFLNDNNDVCFHLSWVLGSTYQRSFLIKCYPEHALKKLE